MRICTSLLSGIRSLSPSLATFLSRISCLPLGLQDRVLALDLEQAIHYTSAYQNVRLRPKEIPTCLSVQQTKQHRRRSNVYSTPSIYVCIDITVCSLTETHYSNLCERVHTITRMHVFVYAHANMSELRLPFALGLPSLPKTQTYAPLVPRTSQANKTTPNLARTQPNNCN